MSQLRTFKLIYFFLLISFASIAQNENRIIPKPSSIEYGKGFFEINKQTKIYISPADPLLVETARWFSDMIYNVKGYRLQIINKVVHPKETNYFLFKYNSPVDSTNPEGYDLTISNEKIIISSNGATGAFYAVQTIRQLLPAEFEKQTIDSNLVLKVPVCFIHDQPRFKWRGMLLDCGRHFMSKDFVKRYIDLLAYYKMNRLHWHLTEDQGWRIEIKKYPLLTTIGAWRTEPDGSTYGGFYTQEDIKEIVQYASAKNVMIVPEIEMPGHCSAALAAYPFLSCTQQKLKVENSWGVFKDVYCAGNDSMFSFLEDVLTEVCSLFPSPYIHIGGDEVPKYRWENCNKCLARMKTEHLKSSHELQSYFINRIEKFLTTKNKKIIGWDEIMEGGLASGATVQSWRSFDGAKEAARKGHDAVVSPTSHSYFDYSVKAIDLEKVYSFNPIPDSLSEAEQKHILGGECNIWTEHTPQELVDTKVFPRILALAEVLWNDKKKDFLEFRNRVRKQYPVLDNLGVTFGFEKLPITIKASYDTEEKLFKVDMEKGMDNVDIYYSVDGTEPTKQSIKYSKQFTIDRTCEIKAVPLRNSITNNQFFSKRVVKHLATGSKVQLKNQFNDSYKASGNNAVTDGIQGSKDDFRDGVWQGYWGKDFECVIDLGRETDISKISSSYLQSNPSWIFMPEYVEYSVSTDGNNFTSVGKVMNVVDIKDVSMLVKDFTFSSDKKNKGRYIKVFAKNIGKCPPWHNAAGSDAWIFIDEVVVE